MSLLSRTGIYFRRDVPVLDGSIAVEKPTKHRTFVRFQGTEVAQSDLELVSEPALRRERESVAITDPEDSKCRLTQDECFVQQRVEHWGEVAGRRIDHLQDLGGRGLLLQRLACLGDEPRVLHPDDRLRREVLQERDLLVSKRPYLTAVYKNRPKQSALAAQRESQRRADTASVDQLANCSTGPVVLGVSRIVDLDDVFSPHHPVHGAARRGPEGPPLKHPLNELGVAAGRDRTAKFTFDRKDVPMRCPAQPQRPV